MTIILSNIFETQKVLRDLSEYRVSFIVNRVTLGSSILVMPDPSINLDVPEIVCTRVSQGIMFAKKYVSWRIEYVIVLSTRQRNDGFIYRKKKISIIIMNCEWKEKYPFISLTNENDYIVYDWNKMQIKKNI